MTKQNFFVGLDVGLLAKRALQGAGIAFLLITLLAFRATGFREGSWVLIPMSLVTFGGAMGGIFFYLADFFRRQWNWNKVLVSVLSLVVYLVGLWMSLIFALSLTGHWD